MFDPRTIVPFVFLAAACSSGADAARASGADAAPDALVEDAPSSSGPDAAPPPMRADAASPPLCDGAHAWSSATRETSVSDPAMVSLCAMTPAQRSVAWRTSTGDVYVADRKDALSDFQAPMQVTSPGSPFARDRVAMTPDARTVVGVAPDGRDFVVFARSRAGAAFAPDGGAAFATLRGWIASRGARIASPVIGASGKTLFFLATISPAPPALHESAWDAQAGAWSGATPVVAPELANADARTLRRPTAASWDDRTLFFFDESSGIERAAFRDAPDAPFTRFVDVGSFPDAIPDQDCVALWFFSSDASGPGLFVAR